PFPAAVLANVYLHRALAYVEMNQPKDALEDLDQAVALPCPTQAFFVRAKVRARLGDKEGAQSDRQEGLRRQPQDETSWLTRGWAKLPADPKGALADFEQALARNPRSIKALQNQAHVLAEYLGRTGEAIAALDRLLEESPDSAAVRASRGVLYARLGKRR